MKSKRSLSGEKKYYLADLSFYYAENTDNKINYGPVLENIVYIYAKSLDYSVSVRRFGNFECDFIIRGTDMQYAYMNGKLVLVDLKDGKMNLKLLLGNAAFVIPL